MTVAISLLIGAALVGWFAPGLLARLVVGGADPLAAIVAWLASAIAVVLTTAAGVVVLLLPGHGLAALHDCWSFIQHGTAPRIEAAGGIAGAALLIVMACRLVSTTVHSVRRRARARAEHLATLRTAARRDGSTLWLAHDTPLAFSLAGKPGVIVATEGLTDHLSPAQVDAVFAHERAHLTGRHHLLVSFADALAHALPFVPLCKLAPAVLRELVELAADSAAVRACGPDAVRLALLEVSQHDTPTTALGIERYFDRPADGTPAHRWPSRRPHPPTADLRNRWSNRSGTACRRGLGSRTDRSRVHLPCMKPHIYYLA